MKVVLDSNIFISSFYWAGNPRKVFERITNGLDESFITDEILKEITLVMSDKKFDTNTGEIEEYIKLLRVILSNYFRTILQRMLAEIKMIIKFCNVVLMDALILSLQGIMIYWY